MKHRSIQTRDVQNQIKHFACFPWFFFVDLSQVKIQILFQSCLNLVFFRCGLAFHFWFYKHDMKVHRYVVVRLDLYVCFVFLFALWPNSDESFYDIYFVHGSFVTLVPEMLALTKILDKWSVQLSSGVFNCKSPGDDRLCHFLDHIIWHNLLMMIIHL